MNTEDIHNELSKISEEMEKHGQQYGIITEKDELIQAVKERLRRDGYINAR